MKILVCLLSDQHVPNLLSVLNQKPNYLFLIESAGMEKKNASRNFQSALENERSNFTQFPKVITIPVGDENNLIALANEFTKQMINNFPAAEWIVNLTGGTKLMSLAAYQAFQQAGNRQFIYIPVNNPNLLQMPMSGESSVIQENISMETFLLGYGFEFAKNKNAIAIAQKEALKRKALTCLIASKSAEKDFRIWGRAIGKPEFRNWLKQMDHAKKPKQLESNYLMPSDGSVLNKVKETFDLGMYPDGSLRGLLDSFAVKYLDGGWLEEFVWNILNDNKKDLNIADVTLGAVIRPVGSGSTNELDVSFIRNYGLNIVECKTGKQQDKMQDNQYKLSAIASSLKALRYSTYLVSNSPNLSVIKERSELVNTKQVNADAIAALAKEPNNIELIKSTFGIK